MNEQALLASADRALYRAKALDRHGVLPDAVPERLGVGV